MAIARQQDIQFGAATGEDVDSMNQALRIAYCFEHDLLNDPSWAARKLLSAGELIGHFGASRGVGHEAIRILQHRGVVQSKTGPHGGLSVAAPTTDSVLAAFSLFAENKHLSSACVAEVAEAARFVSGSLPAEHPGQAVAALMVQLTQRLAFSEQPAPSDGLKVTQRGRAVFIAAQLMDHLRDSELGPAGLRLGHEDELSERFGVSRPVARQAIRILESQSLLSCRRGRSLGYFLREPDPGPLCRLIALWMQGRGFSFRDVLAVEHPLRVSMAMLALRGPAASTQHRLAELQQRSESSGGAHLLDVIEMERNISVLAANSALDVLLRTMTVFKVARAGYLDCTPKSFESYVAVNQPFLRSLFAGDESATERYCTDKNQSLMHVDLRCANQSGVRLS